MNMTESKLRKIIKEEILSESVPSHGDPDGVLEKVRFLVKNSRSGEMTASENARLAEAIYQLTVVLQDYNLFGNYLRYFLENNPGSALHSALAKSKPDPRYNDSSKYVGRG